MRNAKSEKRNAIATQSRKNKGGNFQVVEFKAIREEAAGNENEPSEKHTLHGRCSYGTTCWELRDIPIM